VLSILAAMAAVAMSRMGSSLVANLRSTTDARRLSLDLLQAKRRAIASGDDHYLLLSGAGPYTGYTLYRQTSGGDVAVDTPRMFPAEVVVTSTHNQLQYTFEGNALAAYQVTLTAPDRTWQLSVTPATGTVQTVQTAP